MSLTIDNLFSEGSITGVTLNTQSATIGSFSATTISGGTYYGNAANLTGGTDTFTTGTTFTNNTLTIKKNGGSDVTQLLNNFSGLTINGNLTVTGTSITNILSATTISGGTLFGNGSNLTGIVDSFATGFTYSNNNLTINRNQGLSALTTNISTMSGLTVNGTLVVTGTTRSNIFSGTTISGGTFFGNGANLTGIVDSFTTGFTYSNNNFTISRNQGLSALTTNISTMSGLTVNGGLTVTGTTRSAILSGTTISGGTFFGNGSGLTGISGGTDTFTTGTTFTNNILTIKKNNGSPDVTQLLNNFSGLTINGNLGVTGTTSGGTLNSTIISLTDNTLTSSGLTTGDLIKSNGTKFVSFPKGSPYQLIRVNSGATDVEYGGLLSFSTTPANSTITTTSTSYVLMTGMEFTNVPAGDYFVNFGSSISVNNAGTRTTNVSIYVNGVIVTGSERTITTTDTDHFQVVSIPSFPITVPASATVDIRWNVSASTASAKNRYFTLLKIT